MLGTFEVRRIDIDGLIKDCLIWYEPNYDMYQGAVLADDTVGIVSFLNCKEYTENFIARPFLVGLSFGTVSRLYDFLVTNRASWLSNHRTSHTNAFLETMAQRLQKLRQHWKERGYQEEWVAETEIP